jgi:hypothetical protein
MKEQIFKFKIEIFGVQRMANVKATTLEEAKKKLNDSILSQLKILSTEYKKPSSDDLINKFNDIFGDFFTKKDK